MISFCVWDKEWNDDAAFFCSEGLGSAFCVFSVQWVLFFVFVIRVSIYFFW
jgi:hypothetical protein